MGVSDTVCETKLQLHHTILIRATNRSERLQKHDSGGLRQDASAIETGCLPSRRQPVKTDTVVVPRIHSHLFWLSTRADPTKDVSNFGGKQL